MSLVLAVLPVCEACATGPFQIELKLKLRMSVEIGTTPGGYSPRTYIVLSHECGGARNYVGHYHYCFVSWAPCPPLVFQASYPMPVMRVTSTALIETAFSPATPRVPRSLRLSLLSCMCVLSLQPFLCPATQVISTCTWGRTEKHGTPYTVVSRARGWPSLQSTRSVFSFCKCTRACHRHAVESNLWSCAFFLTGLSRALSACNFMCIRMYATLNPFPVPGILHFRARNKTSINLCEAHFS
jgi:hypothetical protein